MPVFTFTIDDIVTTVIFAIAIVYLIIIMAIRGGE